jgi:nickel transport protein
VRERSFKTVVLLILKSWKGQEKMGWRRMIVIALVLNVSAASVSWSHGVDGDVTPAHGYCVTVRYDDGEPMSYAAVVIQAPDADIEFQTGRTDRNGCFMFQPDGKGNWHVVVRDGMGHGVALDLEVGAGNASDKPEQSGVERQVGDLPRAISVFAGLSIIFGLSGFLYGWKVRRKL